MAIIFSFYKITYACVACIYLTMCVYTAALKHGCINARVPKDTAPMYKNDKTFVTNNTCS